MWRAVVRCRLSSSPSDLCGGAAPRTDAVQACLMCSGCVCHCPVPASAPSVCVRAVIRKSKPHCVTIFAASASSTLRSCVATRSIGPA
eukprot:1440044-Alexandrium_andersonii.AAC.1